MAYNTQSWIEKANGNRINHWIKEGITMKKKQMIFIWRLPNGQIDHVQASSADESLNRYGTRLSWDSDSNTVDVRSPSGKIERYTLNGAY